MTHKFVVIRDEHSKLFGHRLLNSQLSLYLGSVQLFFCLWALSQHIWAMASLRKVLHCDFSPNSTLPPLLTHVDAIIFDIGLFHNLWGISGCVAQHLDGGYGRFCWCVAHSAALLFCLPLAFVSRPRPKWLWPLLIQQSAYGVGLLILSLAALPRAAHFLGDLSNAPIKAIVFYSLGTLMNFFLLFVYWHWYWHVETLWSSARKMRRGETFTSSTIKKSIRRNSPPKIGGEMPLLLGGTKMEEKPIRNGWISEQRENALQTKPMEREDNNTLGGGEEATQKRGQPQDGHGRGGGARRRCHLPEGEDDAIKHPLGQDGGRHRPFGQDGGRHHPFGSSDCETDTWRSANGRPFAPVSHFLSQFVTQKSFRQNHSVDELRKCRRMSHRQCAEAFNEGNSLDAASQSIASPMANLATTQHLHPDGRKPPSPAPSPAGESPSQWNCSVKFFRPSSPNELSLPPRVRHLRREGSTRTRRIPKHWHQSDHSLCCPSSRLSVDGLILPLAVRSVSTKSPQNVGMEEQLTTESNRRPFATRKGTTKSEQIERTAKRCKRRGQLIRSRREGKDETFWRTERGDGIEAGNCPPESGGFVWEEESDEGSDEGTSNGSETDSGRVVRDSFDPKGWSPTVQSSTTTSWSSGTNERRTCLCPIACHSQRQHAELALARPNGSRKGPIGGPIGSVPLAAQAWHGEEGSSSEWSTSWTDSPTHSLQRVSPAPPALFGSSPLRVFGLSALFAPPLEHCV